VNVPLASPARLHGTHCLPTSGARRTDKLSKHYGNLISSVKLLTFHIVTANCLLSGAHVLTVMGALQIYTDDDDDDSDLNNYA